ncbi:hypothetical protein D8T48_11715 [Vibrio vulnificus]|nr:hypothetical protein D8T48_11715 [Vibrio vulnificus]
MSIKASKEEKNRVMIGVIVGSRKEKASQKARRLLFLDTPTSHAKRMLLDSSANLFHTIPTT